MNPQISLTANETSHVAPAVSLSVPSQQIPVVHSKTTVTTDDLEEVSASVYHHVHQEQIFAGEITENIAEIPVVLEQVIVQEIPDVFVPLPLVEEFSAPVFDQVHQVQIAASEMTVDIAEIPVVQEQVIDEMRPERLGDARGPQRCGRTVPSVTGLPPLPDLCSGDVHDATPRAGACGMPAL